MVAFAIEELEERKKIARRLGKTCGSTGANPGESPGHVLWVLSVRCQVHTGHRCIEGISSKIGGKIGGIFGKNRRQIRGISGENRGQNRPKIQNLLFLPRLIIHPKLQIFTPDLN